MGKYKVGQKVMIVFPATANIGLQGTVASDGFVVRNVLRGVVADRIMYFCDWADGDHARANEMCLAPINDIGELDDVKRDEEITA